ncbi:MAG: PQQ-binding-like beta-propeller repeat protein [Planctomycetaceae bacterium]
MVNHNGRFAALMTFALGFVCLPATAEDWPQFRGANADGVARSTCPDVWDATKNVRWKLPLEGEGWSCPVVWGDRVFITAAVRTDKPAEQAAARSQPEPPENQGGQRGQGGRGGRGGRGGGGRGANLTNADYRWDVICLDAKSGEVKWREAARTGHPPLPRHGQNTFATETPVTDGNRVYAYFGMTGLYCYDMEGKLQWEKDLGTYKMRAGWGTGSSPILFEGKLYLQIDNDEKSFLVALDAQSGEEAWRVDRNEPSQYSTPIFWQNSVRSELVAGGQVCRSYHPATGELLWELDMSRGRSSATPLAVGDRLYVGTEGRNRGGDDDGGGYLFAVKVGGSGDITPPADSTTSEHVAWKIAKSGLEASSPSLNDGYLYLLARRGGIVHCIDAETGATAYRSRIPDARAFWASPWTSNNQVFCLDDAGTTHVLANGPELKVISQNVLGEQAWSSPAVANDTLFLRTTEHLYCIAAEKQ